MINSSIDVDRRESSSDASVAFSSSAGPIQDNSSGASQSSESVPDDATLRAFLRKEFKFDDFRPGQKKLIKDLFEAKDSLGIMGTGQGTTPCSLDRSCAHDRSCVSCWGARNDAPTPPRLRLLKRCMGCAPSITGKSLPANFFAAYQKVAVLLIQPLRVLLADSHATSPVPSVLFGSDGGMHARELERLAGEEGTIVVRMTPEWLKAHFTEVRAFHAKRRFEAIIVDEAHLARTWGQSFRKELGNVRDLRDRLGGWFPVMQGLTATVLAGEEAELCDLLGIAGRRFHRLPVMVNKVRQDFVLTKSDDWGKELKIFLDVIRGGKTLVFCQTVPATHAVVDALKDHGVDVRAVTSSAMDKGTAADNVAWLRSQPRGCLAATDVLAMGMDIGDIDTVIHVGLPDGMHTYVQKIGRAGRNGGGNARSICLFTTTDYNNLSWRVFKQHNLDDTARENILDNYSLLVSYVDRDADVPKRASLHCARAGMQLTFLCVAHPRSQTLRPVGVATWTLTRTQSHTQVRPEHDNMPLQGSGGALRRFHHHRRPGRP